MRRYASLTTRLERWIVDAIRDRAAAEGTTASAWLRDLVLAELTATVSVQVPPGPHRDPLPAAMGLRPARAYAAKEPKE